MSNVSSHFGIITSVEKEIAHVEFERSDMCNHCNICGHKSDNKMEVCARNDIGAKVGDTVTVSFGRDKLLIASAIVYLIPLGLFILGLVIGSFINEMVSIILSILFCAASYFILRKINNHLQRKQTYTPRISSIVTK